MDVLTWPEFVWEYLEMFGDAARLSHQFAGGPPHSGGLPRRSPAPTWGSERDASGAVRVVPRGPADVQLQGSLQKAEVKEEAGENLPNGTGPADVGLPCAAGGTSNSHRLVADARAPEGPQPLPPQLPSMTG